MSYYLQKGSREIGPLEAENIVALLQAGDYLPTDLVRPEHAVEMFRLLGGGVFGDMPPGLPNSQLAVLPGTSHFVPPGSGMLDRSDWLLAMLPPFLDA